MKISWLASVFALLVYMSASVVLGAEPDGGKKPTGGKGIDYLRDIQPIFARHCYSCHGPKKQESGYRLDSRVSAMRGGDLGEPAIVPGKSSQSFLLKVVSDPEADVVMPPEGPRLSAAEVTRLKAWIDAGAAWPKGADEPSDGLTTDHWSFQSIKAVALPSMDDPWIAKPVDAFLLKRMAEKGLRPSPAAPRRILIRRLYLDLLGLPPAPEEIQRFESDQSLDAYERLVDRLLASPRYGERWARHWLDIVRFAETDGFEMNQERVHAYHYRDWVIRALNNDEPYDRFVQKQLAGDVLGADAATGFLVGGAYDKVKSPDINLTLMQRQDELADMINTTGTVFLGLTMGCARCHGHKFDPIPQKDYYAWQAVFAGVRHGDRPLPSPKDGQRQRQADQLRVRLQKVEQELERLRKLANSSQTKPSTNKLRPPVNARLNEERFEPRQARFVRFTITATNNGSEPCIDELEIYSVAEGGKLAHNVALASAGAKATSSGNLSGFAIHKLVHVHDSRYGNGRSWISNTRGSGWVQIELARATRIDHIVWGRDREQRYRDRLAISYKIETALERGKWDLAASSSDRRPYDGKSVDTDEILFSRLPKQQADRAKGLIQQKGVLAKQLAALSKPAMLAYAGKFEQPEPTHRLYRGDPMQKREMVRPDALSVLGSLKLDEKTPEQQRRLALARWMGSPQNPLTARVIVNRLWHYHFGVGIVPTPSDFGGGGVAPSHPQLLDWLAGELIRSGWSLKRLHRLILTSSAYRQSSAPNEKGLALDAGGRLLWRFTPRRLEAEAIRDNVLHASGVLDLSMYGPGFSPFEPNQNYVRVYKPKQTWTAADWRRMVYMHKVRMEHDAVFGAFDCPDAGQPTPKRSRSTTAVQALNLLNSRFMLQQAKLFAQRVQRRAGDSIDRQVHDVFLLALGRAPDAVEQKAAGQLVAKHGLAALCRAIFNANEFLFLP